MTITSGSGRRALGLLLASSLLATGVISAGASPTMTVATAPASGWMQTGGLADLIEEVSPSVVLITATGGGAEKTSRPDEHPFFDGPSDEFM
ncbi:MAG: hypothetical protein AAF501_10625, partial [Pseudomonadota bacterium]